MAQKRSKNDVVILSAVRTPIGRFQGGLAPVAAVELGAAVVRAAIEKAGIPDGLSIDEVLMGMVVSSGVGQAPARQAAILAGLDPGVGASTINKVCGSSLKAVMLADQAIRCGDGGLYLCGGMENMSRAPFLVDGRTGELRYGHSQLTDSLLHDGLWDPFENWPMGQAAEFVASVYGISRQEMDEYANESHRRAAAAQKNSSFDGEIIPINVKNRKGHENWIEKDECPRLDCSLEALSMLKPVFKRDGLITAGNAAGLNDGAAAVCVARRDVAEKHGIQPLARIVAQGQKAVEPKYIFDAPARVIPQVLDRAGWKLGDLDLIELNEAFAAQVMANGKALKQYGWDWSKVNVNGGAIALGHPIGASGARILVTLIHALLSKGLRRGLACLCLGGGEAVAILIEAENG